MLSLSDLEFEIFTLVSGLGFWLFGFLWLFYGHHSNEFLGVFLLLLGLSLSVVSIISGVSQYRKKWRGKNLEISQTTYSSTKTQEQRQLPWLYWIKLGLFSNYFDQMFPNFDHLLPSSGKLWTFYILPTGLPFVHLTKDGLFTTFYLLFLVHVVIEWPLCKIHIQYVRI